MQRSNSIHLTVEADHLVSSPSAAQVHAASGAAPRQSVASLPKNLSMSTLDLHDDYEVDHNDKKKQSRIRPEHLLHLIPVVLFFCGLILWCQTTEPSVDYLLEVRGMKPAETNPTVPTVEAVNGVAQTKNMLSARQKSSIAVTGFNNAKEANPAGLKADTAR